MTSLYIDADHAGCSDTSRSTSGWAIYAIQSGGAVALLGWSSRRQQAVARSTGEAEVVAGGDALQYMLGYHPTIEHMFNRRLGSKVWTDSESARLSYNLGYSRKMRHLRKHHRVSVAFIKEALEQLGTKAARVDAADNPADIFTKPLPKSPFLKHVLGLGMEWQSVCCCAELPSMRGRL